MQLWQKQTKAMLCPSQRIDSGGMWGGLVSWEVRFDFLVKVGSVSFLPGKATIVPFVIHKYLMERCFEFM